MIPQLVAYYVVKTSSAFIMDLPIETKVRETHKAIYHRAKQILNNGREETDELTSDLVLA